MICSPQGKQKTRLTSADQRKRHNLLHVKHDAGTWIQRESGETKNIMDAMDTVDTCNVEDETEGTRKHSFPTVCRSEMFRVVETVAAAGYYWNNIIGKGNMYLVNKQIYGNDILAETPIDDVNMHLLITMLLIRISQGDTKILTRILSLVVKKKREEKDNILRKVGMLYATLGLTTPLNIPSSNNDIRKYWDPVNSIVKSTSTPTLFEPYEGAVYVLPSEC